jgi:hypothetical protein
MCQTGSTARARVFDHIQAGVVGPVETRRFGWGTCVEMGCGHSGEWQVSVAQRLGPSRHLANDTCKHSAWHTDTASQHPPTRPPVRDVSLRSHVPQDRANQPVHTLTHRAAEHGVVDP